MIDIELRTPEPTVDMRIGRALYTLTPIEAFEAFGAGAYIMAKIDSWKRNRKLLSGPDTAKAIDAIVRHAISTLSVDRISPRVAGILASEAGDIVTADGQSIGSIR